MFRRDVLVEIGGLDPNTIGEDAEVVVRLHRRLREQRRDYRIVFVGEPVSWTEVPDSVAVLGNPRYSRIGLLALPYYLLFEAVAPVIELAGIILVPLGLVVGVVDLLVIMVATAAENFGFRQLRAWWRVRGGWHAARRRHAEWGVMTRQGF